MREEYIDTDPEVMLSGCNGIVSRLQESYLFVPRLSSLEQEKAWVSHISDFDCVVPFVWQAAQDAIKAATIEAKCNLPNGIGVVKVSPPPI